MHYKVVDDLTWQFLYDRYGGNDMLRLSIEVATTSTQVDHIVEINLRRFTVVTYPRVKYLQGLISPHHVFVSRKATVRELHTMLCRRFAEESN